jgi:hypothetical protein
MKCMWICTSYKLSGECLQSALATRWDWVQNQCHTSVPWPLVSSSWWSLGGLINIIKVTAAITTMHFVYSMPCVEARVSDLPYLMLLTAWSLRYNDSHSTSAKTYVQIDSGMHGRTHRQCFLLQSCAVHHETATYMKMHGPCKIALLIFLCLLLLFKFYHYFWQY